MTDRSRLISESGGRSSDAAEILAGGSNLVPTGSQCEHTGPTDWQTAIKRAIRCGTELKQILGLPPDQQGGGQHQFPVFVPWEYLARIRPGDPHDPLLRQVLPLPEETIDRSGFTADPVGDLNSLVAGGLLHKYAGRALLIASGACGIHCRYCFRREFPYADAGSRRQNWRPAIEYIRDHAELEEVILSGGDPLTLVDDRLDDLIQAIEQISHVRRLRIHTRMPIVIPQRVTDVLVDRLSHSRLTIWLVIHSNHANELDQSVLDRLSKVIEAGIPVLNQSVLLRGVNDNAAALIELCRTLVNHRVQPYYLHQLDRVRGAAHFEVPIDEGKLLMAKLYDALPGYAVPTYVLERAGATQQDTDCVRNSSEHDHVRFVLLMVTKYAQHFDFRSL